MECQMSILLIFSVLNKNFGKALEKMMLMYSSLFSILFYYTKNKEQLMKIVKGIRMTNLDIITLSRKLSFFLLGKKS